MLALRAAGRRPVVFLSVLLAWLAVVSAYFTLRPAVYRVEAKILAQRQQALPSVVRAVYDEAPTRSAWESVHRRENLIALIRQAKLLPDDATAEPEPTAHGDGNAATKALTPGAPGPERTARGEYPLDALIRILDKQLAVEVEEGTITIHLDWRDPQVAYNVVNAAVQNFLEARYVHEVKAADEVISILQARAASLQQELETAVEEARHRTATSPRPLVPRVRQPSEALMRAQSLLEAKQRAIQDVEGFRRRRLADVQAQHDEARNTMSSAHPTVIKLLKDIESLSRESPQIAMLRQEEQQLRKDYQARVAREGVPPGASPIAVAPVYDPANMEGEDQRVREARLQYEQMVSRVNTSQVELEAARAAFKYRYAVIWPPEVPSDPVSPNPRKIFGAGGLLALLLALAAAAAPDVLRGRIVERWQVERSLHLSVLGEIHRRT